MNKDTKEKIKYMGFHIGLIARTYSKEARELLYDSIKESGEYDEQEGCYECLKFGGK